MEVVIFEDEKLASDRLCQLLKELRPELHVVTTLRSVEAAKLWLQQNPAPSLIISDIQLLDGESFQVFEEVRVDCPVIFTTAYDEYAIKAFDVNSIDYLLKPIQKEKLRLALTKYDQRTTNSSQAIDFNKIQALINSEKEYKSRFLVKFGQRIKAVPVDKIAYFFSKDKLTYLVTFDGQKLPIDQTLEELESLMDPKGFFRVNRQFMVHFDGVADIHPYFKGRVKLVLEPASELDIVVSSEKTPVFKKWLDQ